MMRSVLLGDICSYVTEKIAVDQIALNDYVSTENLLPDKGGLSLATNLPRVGKVTRYKKGDVLVSNIRPYFKKIWHANRDGGASNDVLVLRPNDHSILHNYLYYVLKNDSFFDFSTESSSGSKMPRGDKAQIMKYQVYLPHIDTQKKIAATLGALDKKIELNRKMNETLEQMGQALFRHYFIDNSEVKKWDVKPLGEFIEVVNGASYKSSELKPSNHALVTLKSIERGGGFSRRGYKEFTGKFKESQIVRDGDLIVAHTDLTQKAEVAGYPAVIDGADQYAQVVISMDLVKVVPLSGAISSSVIYFLLKTREFQDHKMRYLNGSTVLHLNKKCIPNYQIALPDDNEILLRISAEFDSFMKQIKVNNQQIQTLTTLRDNLLPRLMNGKLKT